MATQEELQWALAIKKAAVAQTDIQAELVTDWEFWQHAFIAKNKVDKALQRIQRVQQIKLEYGIKLDGSPAEGMRDLKAFFAAHPGFFISLSRLPDQSHVFCGNYGCILAKNIHSRESMAIVMRGFFYTIQACQPDMPSVRAGVHVLGDVKEMGWQNFSLRFERTVSALSNAYPMRIHHVIMMNAHFLVRLFFHIIKAFLSKKIVERHQFVGDLDEFLKQSTLYTNDALPTEWNGTVDRKQFLFTLGQNLEKRYTLACEFKLTDDDDDDNDDDDDELEQ